LAREQMPDATAHKKKVFGGGKKVKIVNKKRLLLNQNIPFFIKLLINFD
jgi:hypothetical protein